jgi:uncharacterized phage-associated protein
MAYKATAVAQWLLYLAAQKGNRLSPMQLQKILYYTQGYSLGMSGEKMFDDPIMAWEHGPVAAEVYRQFKKYGGRKILPPESVDIPEDIIGVLDVVVTQKSALSAAALRNDTHKEMPYASTARDTEIAPLKMENFFSGLFWTSDEEDSYEPAFDTEEEELSFFNESFSEEKKKTLINACLS